MQWLCPGCGQINAGNQVQCGQCHKSRDDAKSFQQAVVALLDGLIAERAEHKQFYLEKAIRTICTDYYVDEAKKIFKWEAGVDNKAIPLHLTKTEEPGNDRPN